MKLIEKSTLYIIISILAIISLFSYIKSSQTPKTAYIDSSKLMVGFSEADRAEKEIKAAEKDINDKLKVLKDTLDNS